MKALRGRREDVRPPRDRTGGERVDASVEVAMDYEARFGRRGSMSSGGSVPWSHLAMVHADQRGFPLPFLRGFGMVPPREWNV
jgi:hypothetical protein